MLIKALGGLELEGAEFRRPKLLLLLTYLSIEGTKDRRFISELFWGDKEDPTTNLRSAVYGIKKVMPLEVDDDSISMSPSVGCDATMLLQALDKKDLETAIKLYQGPFLEDARLPDISEELDEWIYSTRLYIGSKLRLALIQEAERLAVEGDFETAGAYAEKAYQVLDDSTLESTDLEIHS